MLESLLASKSNNDKMIKEIDEYFKKMNELMNKMIDDKKHHDDWSHEFDLLIEEMLQKPILEQIDSILTKYQVFKSEEQKNIFYYNCQFELGLTSSTIPFPPVELLEEKNILYIGENPFLKEATTMKLIKNSTCLHDKDTIYCLYSIDDLMELKKKYHFIFFGDDSLYLHGEKIGNRNACVWLYDSRYFYDVATHFETFSDIGLNQKIQFVVENYLKQYYSFKNHFKLRYREENPDLYVGEDMHFNSEIAKRIKKIPNFYFLKDNEWRANDINFGYGKNRFIPISSQLTREFFARTDKKSDITIRISNLRNYYYAEKGENTKGYLKISKTNPICITPVNATENDYQWLQQFVELNYFEKLKNVLVNSSYCLEDLIFMMDFEKYLPPKLEKPMNDIALQSYFFPENDYYYQCFKHLVNIDVGRASSILYFESLFENMEKEEIEAYLNQFILIAANNSVNYYDRLKKRFSYDKEEFHHNTYSLKFPR